MPATLTAHVNTNRKPTGQNRGFAFLVLLIFIAVLSVIAASALQVGSIMQRHVEEEELLAIGSEFRRALISYSSATPVGQSASPPNLQALLKDPRYPNIRRHLRKLYFDPLTGNQQWGTTMSTDGKGIVGVYSLSKGIPIKTTNFDIEFLSFDGKKSYADWIFTATTLLPVTQTVTQTTNGTSTTTTTTTNSANSTTGNSNTTNNNTGVTSPFNTSINNTAQPSN